MGNQRECLTGTRGLWSETLYISERADRKLKKKRSLEEAVGNSVAAYIFFLGLSSLIVIFSITCFTNLRKETIGFVMCPCLSPWKISSPTERIFMKFNIWVFFENMLRKLNFYWPLTRITGTLHEDLCTFIVISRSILLSMRNLSDKICRENQNTRFMFKNFFRKSCRLWYNVKNIW
jgi:hypothetical protein